MRMLLANQGIELAGPAGEKSADPESRGLVRRIGLCAAFTMNVMLFSLPVYFGMEATFEYARLFGLLSLAWTAFIHTVDTQMDLQ